jgi:hypothetical protein
MPSQVATIFVITALLAVASPTAAQQIEPLVDSEAYRILSDLIPQAWDTANGELLLQRETTIALKCTAGVLPDDPDWGTAARNFRDQNARTRLLLELMLPIRVPHRLISRSEIEADDARLALKYPGFTNWRPESMAFVAVSAVGFNAAKTRAIVYVRLRDRGNVRFLERREGKWVRSWSRGCGWAA